MATRVRLNPEVRPFAALLSGQQAGVGENGQVVAHGGLRPSGRLDEVTRAHLSRGRVRNQTEQLQTNRVGQHLEPGGEFSSIPTFEWLGKHRFTTCLNRRHLHGGSFLQKLILTNFNIADIFT